ncbi:2-dehydropantoate 2-reductase [uncultured Paraglaciecola sp.]|uniref:2-dehydropantoate 2-reductase n=1 Tax=uncultured Paraglaciecola sp. TaxID=1765024 RepID=UPI00262E47E3|nr:2-dehydropantoate 2-reductase [uncultured Paraglaciecola sp.]
MTDDFSSKQQLIFGAGLIGCYLGAVLTSLGLPTRLICRPSVKHKLKSGIRLTDYLENQVVVDSLELLSSQQLGSDTQHYETADFLWLTVKCTGVEQAMEDIAPFVNKHTVIFCCQNGLGSDAIVKQAYPDNLVLRVMVPFNVAELADGHYHRGSEGAMTLEYHAQSYDLVSSIINRIESVLLPVKATNDMDSLLWAKLQLNLGNSINALADIPVKAMLQQRSYRKVIALLMSELLQVVDALGIALPKVTSISAHNIPKVLRLPNFIFNRVANKMLAIDPQVRSSMWWDVSQGKPTEIEHINGAILKHAKTLEMACPVNQKISQLISQLSDKTPLRTEQKPPIAANTLLAWVTEK